MGFTGLSKLDFEYFLTALSQLPIVANKKFKQFHNRLDALYNFAVEQKIEGHRSRSVLVTS
jgi:hypothetical protein